MLHMARYKFLHCIVLYCIDDGDGDGVGDGVDSDCNGNCNGDGGDDDDDVVMCISGVSTTSRR